MSSAVVSLNNLCYANPALGPHSHVQVCLAAAWHTWRGPWAWRGWRRSRLWSRPPWRCRPPASCRAIGHRTGSRYPPGNKQCGIVQYNTLKMSRREQTEQRRKGKLSSSQNVTKCNEWFDESRNKNPPSPGMGEYDALVKLFKDDRFSVLLCTLCDS
jgi:hypothetical protein